MKPLPCPAIFSCSDKREKQRSQRAGGARSAPQPCRRAAGAPPQARRVKCPREILILALFSVVSRPGRRRGAAGTGDAREAGCGSHETTCELQIFVWAGAQTAKFRREGLARRPAPPTTRLAARRSLPGARAARVVAPRRAHRTVAAPPEPEPHAEAHARAHT